MGENKLSDKENFMRSVRHQIPEFVPRHAQPSTLNDPVTQMVIPGCSGYRMTDHGTVLNLWGTECMFKPGIATAPMHIPGKYMLTDITKWRDALKAPDLSGVNWEQMVKKDMENVDRENHVVLQYTGDGFFIDLVGLMGFEQTLLSMSMEPEEVMALWDYMCSYYETVLKNTLEYIKPDIVMIVSETSNQNNPFFSLDMYRSMVKPFEERLAKIVKEHGVCIMLHDCGRAEAHIDDWLEYGVDVWDAPGMKNDILGVKKRYKGKLTICGGWNAQGPEGMIGATEDVVRSAVRKTIDAYAPEGDYIFFADLQGLPDSPEFQQRCKWITEEYNSYGRSFYETH
jgi:hypothetical protein